MLSYTDYLRLLPKAELHCHLIATIRPVTLIELARRYDVPLPTYDTQALFDYDNIVDFLAVLQATMPVFKNPADLERVAYESVEDAVAAGNLRYREYFINASEFSFGYVEAIDAVTAGLTAAEADFGVGFGIIPAIDRSRPPSEALALVQLMIVNPRTQVVGLGQDDLAPDNTESPELFVDAYTLAHEHGIPRTAHVGEIHGSSAANITIAIDQLRCSRIDHGYHVIDDPAVLETARQLQIPFTCTPFSTNVLSGWPIDAAHPVAQMIRAGLNVTFSTDDPTFFRTDIGREYVEGLPAMGFGPEVAKRIALAGMDAAWCPPEQKARLHAEFLGQMRALDAVLDRSTVPRAVTTN